MPKAAVKEKPAVDPNDELGGLTATECPFDCNAEKCVISGRGVCSHPNKGGLQAVVMSDQEALKRYNRARKILAIAAANKRG